MFHDHAYFPFIAVRVFTNTSKNSCTATIPSLIVNRCVFESLLCSMDDVTCMGSIGGSVRSDDDFYYTTDDDVDAEEAGSNGATGRWRGPGIVVFALVGIAAAAIPVLGSSVTLV